MSMSRRPFTSALRTAPADRKKEKEKMHIGKLGKGELVLHEMGS